MPKFIEVKISLSEDLCDWIEGILKPHTHFIKPQEHETIPSPATISVEEFEMEDEEEPSEEEYIASLGDNIPEGAATPEEPHKRYKGVINWTDDPHTAFVRLHGKTLQKLMEAAEGYFGIPKSETDFLSRDELVNLLLSKQYGVEVAKEYDYKNHMVISEMEPLVVAALKKRKDWVFTTELRQKLWDDGYKFNPKKIYDVVGKLYRLGVIEKKDTGSEIRIADPNKRADKDWNDLSDLERQAIKTMDNHHSMEDVARIVMNSLELNEDDELTTDRLTAVIAYIAEKGFCPILSLGEKTQKQYSDILWTSCNELLTARLDSLTS